MSEEIDLQQAHAVMLAATAIADDPAQHSSPDFKVWEKRIQAFSRLVDQATYTASIAVVGGQLVAKATNPRVDSLSLQVSDTVPGSHSLRHSTDKVLYPASVIHSFDIGSTSKNPINGQTFNKLKRVDLTLKIKGKGQQLVRPLVELLHEVNQLKDRESGTRALAAYVHVRRGYVLTYKAPTGIAGLVGRAELIAAISEFVAERSEGGGRAQAVAGGLFDVLYGSARVRVGKTNEPDRKVAGDVIVWDCPAGTTAVKAIEVRDKIVDHVDVLSTIQKLQRAAVPKGAVLAVAAHQPELLSEDYAEPAATAGIQLEIYRGWTALVREILFWSDSPEPLAVRAAIENIRSRLTQIEISSEAVDLWDKLTLKSATQSEAVGQAHPSGISA